MPQVWKWTPAKREILTEVFLGLESQMKIAQKHHMSRDALRACIRNDEFRKELKALRDQLEQTLFEEDVRYVTKEHRITAISRKAESASEEYEAHKWVEEERSDGDGGTITNLKYNRDAYDAFHKSLDDIAKELGHRKSQLDVTSNGETLQGLTIITNGAAAASDPRYVQQGIGQADETSEATP